MTAAHTPEVLDVLVVGGGPGGLSAALQLVRSTLRVGIVDSNRPRHAATLQSHGFLTRDGASPLELRRLGREEFTAYPGATFVQGTVTGIARLDPGAARAAGFGDGIGFAVDSVSLRGKHPLRELARRVLLATGLIEQLPALPSMRAYYGTALHSCIACDAYEKRGTRLALIGDTADLAERAVLLTRFSRDLIVFTNGSSAVTPAEEARLAARGVRVERREIADLTGERATLTGVALADGTVVPRDGGFVRPRWHARLDFLRELPVDTDEWGLVRVGPTAETASRGVYAVGDLVPPGPEQLIIAAGDGARSAAHIVADLTRADA